MFSEVFLNGVFCISKNLRLKIPEIRNASNTKINKDGTKVTFMVSVQASIGEFILCTPFTDIIVLLKTVPGRNRVEIIRYTLGLQVSTYSEIALFVDNPRSNETVSILPLFWCERSMKTTVSKKSQFG